MNYVYRADEDIDRLPVAPYVLREVEADVPQHPPDPTMCGTMHGYWQHIRYKQAQCDRCNQAQAEHGVEVRARKAGNQRAEVADVFTAKISQTTLKIDSGRPNENGPGMCYQHESGA